MKRGRELIIFSSFLPISPSPRSRLPSVLRGAGSNLDLAILTEPWVNPSHFLYEARSSSLHMQDDGFP